ncbi:MAG TPA: EscU/YscU/HrcU family type III secretion system export apparatus switch protein [Stenomitos sp.]
MAEAEEELKQAVALSYDEGVDEAPRVVASGKGLVAEKILELAVENEVAIHRDPLLVQGLAALEVGEQIPAEFYPMVAEILVFVQRMNREKGNTGR